jgi:hypothetical protein
MEGAEEPSAGWQIRARPKWAALAWSILMIVPCVWHRHIEAGDLGSHIYNAWLAQLIAKGQAPGLYIVRKWDNVLVDWLLLHAANVFGFSAAQKIVVSFCVLVFFWGVFVFVSAFTRRPPWSLAPCIAMLAYGYSFNMGFLNYYLSLGLACWSFALLWRGRRVARIVGLLVVPLVLLAHPLGLLWLAGVGLYVVLWTRLPRWWKVSVPIAAIAVLCAIRWYLAHVARYPVDFYRAPFYFLNGADQLILYGSRYGVLAWVAVGFGAVCVAMDAVLRRADPRFWKSLRLPAGFYLVAMVATALLPENLRPSIDGGWIGLLVSRLTTLTAIFGLCVLAFLRPRKLHAIGFGACAIVFFAFLYRDTLVLNRMEAATDRLVSGLPAGTRVLSTIWAPPGSRVSFVAHFVDRACIARCFSYANYEPASRQFRIRVRAGSPVVGASDDDNEDMQAGEYEVRDEDLPMVEIYQCDPANLTKLCLRSLVAGEKNGRLGYKPPSD